MGMIWKNMSGDGGSGPQEDKKHQGAVIEDEEVELKEPSKYAVILHNDDFTTMDFVVEVLRKFFRKTEEEAVQIMTRVHQLGSAVCGIFPFEIAETKVVQVTDYAKTHGFPLRCTMEAR